MREGVKGKTGKNCKRQNGYCVVRVVRIDQVYWQNAAVSKHTYDFVKSCDVITLAVPTQ